MKKTFEKYVDLDKIDWSKSPETQREMRELEYVIVAVRDDDLERQAALIGEVGTKSVARFRNGARPPRLNHHRRLGRVAES